MAREEIKQVGESKNNGTQITLRDILNIFWINRWWFVISVFICLALAVIYLKKTPKIYSRSASVLVKSQKGGGGAGMSQTAVFQDMGVFGMMTSDVNNEFYVFKSYKLMQDVVERLNLTVNYYAPGRLRRINLYNLSPITANFVDASPNYAFSLKAKVLDENTVQLFGFKESGNKFHANGAAPVTIKLNDTVDTPVGRVYFASTDRVLDYAGQPIDVVKSGFKATVLNYVGKVAVTIADRQATVLNLSMKDVSEARAEDVLNTLIDAYNSEALNDKNTISRSTDKFINDRLEVINEELGAVDADIASYKSASGLTDVTTETSGYAAEGSEYRKSGLAIENQLAIARQIQGYISNPSNRNQPLPSNLGLDAGIEAQISQYNNLLLQRNKLFASSSEKNPLVQDLDAQLIPLKQTISSSVNNLVSSLAIQAGNVRSREAMTRGRIAAIPRQQNNLFSKERQQKIKEELYLYLLNKREENALSLAMTESNIKVIDKAKGPLAPVAPRSTFIMAIALLIGLAIPAILFWLKDILDVSVRGRKDVEDA
ncbi:MAG: chromosome partitioning protein ParA, partial [Bacteroidales bacterium]|nr:chromosome partitioning protein ParA [Bacteroidales bacterium]